MLGGVAGATIAGRVSTAVLQWSYVGYLVALDALLLVRTSRTQPSAVTGNRPEDANPTEDACRTDVVGWLPLLAVGLLGGLPSGYLGIGGGLAIVAGLTGGLKVPQHQAQMVSLVLSIIPTTIPAAYVYWRAGQTPPLANSRCGDRRPLQWHRSRCARRQPDEVHHVAPGPGDHGDCDGGIHGVAGLRCVAGAIAVEWRDIVGGHPFHGRPD